MKLTHCKTDTYLLAPFRPDAIYHYSDTNFNRTQSYQRLLTLINKVIDEPHIFRNIQEELVNAKNFRIQDQFFKQDEYQVQEFRNNQMELQNFMEIVRPVPKLQYKTSIQNRIPVCDLNPQIQPSPFSISILPSENQKIDFTSKNIDLDDSLSIDHLKALFEIQDISLMITTLGYLSKLPASEQYKIMNSNLRKFAACYLIAYKIDNQSASKGILNGLSQILGLDQDTLLLLEKELLASINFRLQLSKQYLYQITKLLLQ